MERRKRTMRWKQLKAFYREQVNIRSPKNASEIFLSKETENEREYVKRYLVSDDEHKDALKKMLLMSGDDEEEEEERKTARNEE